VCCCRAYPAAASRDENDTQLLAHLLILEAITNSHGNLKMINAIFSHISTDLIHLEPIHMPVKFTSSLYRITNRGIQGFRGSTN
jgi:hypothetical protein